MRKITLVILLALSFLLIAGCGKKDEENTTNNGGNEQNPAPQAVINPDTVHSDNNKIVFRNEQTKMVFGYEGTNITSYKVYVDYSDETTAKTALGVLEANKEDNVEKYSLEGKYVVVEYKPSEFSGFTVDGVRQMYSYLEEIKN